MNKSRKFADGKAYAKQALSRGEQPELIALEHQSSDDYSEGVLDGLEEFLKGSRDEEN